MNFWNHISNKPYQSLATKNETPSHQNVDPYQFINHLSGQDYVVEPYMMSLMNMFSTLYNKNLEVSPIVNNDKKQRRHKKYKKTNKKVMYIKKFVKKVPGVDINLLRKNIKCGFGENCKFNKEGNCRYLHE